MTGKVARVKTSVNSKGRTATRNGTKKAALSGIAPKKASKQLDQRVRRTRDALGDALVALMREKPFKSITVQHVLDRAKVGRATFYSHFRDKDDLFLSDVEEFFNRVAEIPARNRSARRVAPVAELFAHIEHTRDFFAALVASGRLEAVMEIGQECFARGIDKHLAALDGHIPSARRRAMSQAFSGAMLALLQWWLSRAQREPAEAMDELFHQLVWHGATVRK
jgi:AcrR family transcriptional regulator